MTKAFDLTGKKFGRLKVMSEAETTTRPDGRAGEKQWSCVCKCGGTKKVRRSSLTSGKVRSCGCLRIEEAVKWGRARKGKPRLPPKKIPALVLTPFLGAADVLVAGAIYNMVAWGRQFDHVPLNSPIVPIGAHQ